MEVSFGNYLNAKTCSDAEIGEFMNEGIQAEIDDKFHAGKKRKVYNFDVKYKDQDMILTPTDVQGNVLVKAFGKDTKAWIGKKFQTFLVQDKLVLKPLI